MGLWHRHGDHLELGWYSKRPDSNSGSAKHRYRLNAFRGLNFPGTNSQIVPPPVFGPVAVPSLTTCASSNHPYADVHSGTDSEPNAPNPVARNFSTATRNHASLQPANANPGQSRGFGSGYREDRGSAVGTALSNPGGLAQKMTDRSIGGSLHRISRWKRLPYPDFQRGQP